MNSIRLTYLSCVPIIICFLLPNLYILVTPTVLIWFKNLTEYEVFNFLCHQFYFVLRSTLSYYYHVRTKYYKRKYQLELRKNVFSLRLSISI